MCWDLGIECIALSTLEVRATRVACYAGWRVGARACHVHVFMGATADWLPESVLS